MKSPAPKEPGLWWKVLWEKLKTSFSTSKAKADRCLHEMLFADRTPRAAYRTS
ncbi:hypothetical protein KCP69_13635 [Salmonella enterica subsp. enterica]|nr:hypothetical protein KCP69_13635 [Salmonella enterica subsp. enterica]